MSVCKSEDAGTAPPYSPLIPKILRPRYARTEKGMIKGLNDFYMKRANRYGLVDGDDLAIAARFVEDLDSGYSLLHGISKR